MLATPRPAHGPHIKPYRPRSDDGEDRIRCRLPLGSALQAGGVARHRFRPCMSPFRLTRRNVEAPIVPSLRAPLIGILPRLPARRSGARRRRRRTSSSCAPGVTAAQGRAVVAPRADTSPAGADHPRRRRAASAAARARLERDRRVKAVSANARARAQAATVDSPARDLVPALRLRPAGLAPATGAGVGVAVIDTGIDGRCPTSAAPTAVARDRLGGHEPRREDGARRLRPRHARRRHHRRQRREPADGDPAAGKYIGVAPEANLIAIKAADDDGHATILDAIYGCSSSSTTRTTTTSASSTCRWLDAPVRTWTDPLDAAVEAAYFSGILVVAAAGNRGTDHDAATTRRATTRSRSRSARSTIRARRRIGRHASPPGRASARRRTASASPTCSPPGAHIVSRWPPAAPSPGSARTASSTTTTSAWAARRWRRRSSPASRRWCSSAIRSGRPSRSSGR